MTTLEITRPHLVKFLVVIAVLVLVHLGSRTLKKCPCEQVNLVHGPELCLSFVAERCMFDERSLDRITRSKCKPRSCLFSPKQVGTKPPEGPSLCVRKEVTCQSADTVAHPRCRILHAASPR